MRSFMKDMQFHVSWSAEDEEWVATVDQFPSLSCLQTDPVSALSGLIFFIEDTIKEMWNEEHENGGES